MATAIVPSTANFPFCQWTNAGSIVWQCLHDLMANGQIPFAKTAEHFNTVILLQWCIANIWTESSLTMGAAYTNSRGSASLSQITFTLLWLMFWSNVNIVTSTNNLYSLTYSLNVPNLLCISILWAKLSMCPYPICMETLLCNQLLVNGKCFPLSDTIGKTAQSVLPHISCT